MTAQRLLHDNACVSGDRIVIHGITFLGHCGVTLDERQQPQPLSVDLEMECALQEAMATDDLRNTVDYARVTARVMELGPKFHCALLESLAEHLSRTLLAEFPVLQRLHLWIRKVAPPLPDCTGSVGIKISRQREVSRQSTLDDEERLEPPAPFLEHHLALLPRGSILDVASGSGRNALFLASRGFPVTAVDRNQEALAALTALATRHRLSTWISTTCQDLESQPSPCSSIFGVQQFEGIIVFFYLFRPLFPALIQALKPGGVLVYETFLIDNHLLYQHPRRRAFCLEHNELLQLIKPLRVLVYEEGQHEGPARGYPAWTARVIAQKPASPPMGHL
ncbi:MAG: dihydroneopterin aldolase [Nitrospirae bacterium]|nr:MAG: dihydroneopterin aldolase [Nitrospirota bacterium]